MSNRAGAGKMQGSLRYGAKSAPSVEMTVLGWDGMNDEAGLGHGHTMQLPGTDREDR